METTIPQVKKSPRDFFLHLLSNLALYYSAVWLITLWWQLINRAFPDSPLRYAYETTWLPTAMRWAIASLVIVFPLYLYLVRFLNRDLEANPEKRELKIRKWLIYITLSIAAITIVIDLITLLYNLLEGDFALPYILKTLAVLIVAGMVFGYYWYELRRDTGHSAPNRKIFYTTSVILVALSVIGSFFVVGSPKTARMVQYDNRRVNDLQSLQWQVVNYWQQKGKLPTSIDALQDPLSGYTIPKDPETGAAYEYRSTASTTFELCATFSLPGNQNQLYSDISYPKPLAGSDNWEHEAGRDCFTRTIDPELYPPKPKL